MVGNTGRSWIRICTEEGMMGPGGVKELDGAWSTAGDGGFNVDGGGAGMASTSSGSGQARFLNRGVFGNG
jgi:hypothetical protein